MAAFFVAIGRCIRFFGSTLLESKPCFGMSAKLKNAKIAFVTLILFPLLLSVFVATIGGVFIRSVFGPVISVLSGASTDSGTPIEPSIPYVTYLALALGLFVAVLFVSTFVMWRKAARSKNGVQSDIVIIEPENLIVEDVELVVNDGEEVAGSKFTIASPESSRALASD